jgi:hypothetical protein
VVSPPANSKQVVSPPKNHKTKKRGKPRARARAERSRRQLRDDWIDARRRENADVNRAILIIMTLVGIWAAIVLGHAWLGVP